MIYKGLKLDKFQEEAIDSINNENSVIISAPTGAGKTLVAEFAIEQAIKNNKGIIYTAPVKALSNQKYRDFRKAYPEKTGILTGDVSINPQAPILIMTTEIFRNVILTDPERLTPKEWVIFDEIHYLDDIDRGTVWEEALMLMPRHIKVLALSATVPNVNSIAEWLRKIHDIPIKIIKEYNRPVPLSFYFQADNNIFSNFSHLQKSELLLSDSEKLKKKKYESLIHPKPNRTDTLFKKLREQNLLPCIYFAFSRKRTEIFAQELATFNFLTKEERKQITNLYSQLLAKFGLENETTSVFLYDLIKRGVAFHHAGLLPTLKEVIERLFTSKLLKVIFTTETFALGVNMPARTVVFDDIRKIYGRFYRNLKTRDFYQMAGRAGRRGIDKEGYVFVKVNPWRVTGEELEDTIYGDTEIIQSQLRSNYATILNLYQDMKEKIYDIYPLSFHSFQSKMQSKEQAIRLLKNKINLLKELEYITPNKELSWKGKLASHMYSYELQTGQLYEEGFLENLNQKELAIVICALVYEPRKGQKKPPLTKRVKKVAMPLNKLSKSIYRYERKFHIFPYSKRFYFHLSKVIDLWYDGIGFSKLSKYTDIDEGELVRYLRMSIQVLRELNQFQGFKADFKKNVRKILVRINRGLVDAEKQLRQEI